MKEGFGVICRKGFILQRQQLQTHVATYVKCLWVRECRNSAYSMTMNYNTYLEK